LKKWFSTGWIHNIKHKKQTTIKNFIVSKQCTFKWTLYTHRKGYFKWNFSLLFVVLSLCPSYMCIYCIAVTNEQRTNIQGEWMICSNIRSVIA
jgi:hypothetical protein